MSDKIEKQFNNFKLNLTAYKAYIQNCLKIFILTSTIPMMIHISGKSAHLTQKSWIYQKISNTHSLKLSKAELRRKCNT